MTKTIVVSGKNVKCRALRHNEVVSKGDLKPNLEESAKVIPVKVIARMRLKNTTQPDTHEFIIGPNLGDDHVAYNEALTWLSSFYEDRRESWSIQII